MQTTLKNWKSSTDDIGLEAIFATEDMNSHHYDTSPSHLWSQLIKRKHVSQSHCIICLINKTGLQSPHAILVASQIHITLLPYNVQKLFWGCNSGRGTEPKGMVNHELSVTVYITVVGEKALMLLIRLFRMRTGIPGQTHSNSETQSRANSLNTNTTGNIKRSMHRMVSWFTSQDLEILFS